MEQRTLIRSSWRRFTSNQLNLIGGALILFLVLVGTLAPWISPHNPREQSWGEAYQAPSPKYPLGVDQLGRGILSRLIYGARTSLIIGLFAPLIGLVIGVTLGGLAGYKGGLVSQLVMRLVDIFLSIPSLILMIVAASVLEQRNIFTIIIIIGILQWTRVARITRSKFMDIKENDYIESAKAIGGSELRIIGKHVLPNSFGPIMVYTTLNVGAAIISESSLSFLGLGDPRTISWGTMISEGLDEIIMTPWLAVFPGIAIFITVWSANVLGDGLRDVMDVEV